MSEIMRPEDLQSDEIGIEDDFEVISGEEVDQVIAVLEELMDRVSSDNIRGCLEEATNAIFYLVYSDDDLEDQVSEAA